MRPFSKSANVRFARARPAATGRHRTSNRSLNDRSVPFSPTSPVSSREWPFSLNSDFRDERNERPVTRYTGQSIRKAPTSPMGRSTSPAVPDAAVQPRWSLSRRLPPRATAVTGFGSPRRWRRTSSSEVERPLAKKRCGGLLSAAAATPQRSSSDSSQSEAVVASGISTDSSWPKLV